MKHGRNHAAWVWVDGGSDNEAYDGCWKISETRGAMIGGPTADHSIARAEAVGLLDALTYGPLMSGAVTKQIHLVDRKSCEEIFHSLERLTSRQLLKLNNRDIWESCLHLKREFGDSIEVRWPQS